jgi:parallel beta-helix repeat protein
MIKILKTLLITGPLFTGVFLWSSLDVAHAKKPILVNCETGKSVQAGVNSAKSGDTVFLIGGTCAGDVTITTDDIILSGNMSGLACDRENPGGDGTIEGTITVKSVRARIEFLTITGPGDGVLITDRATVELDCNDISDNAENGVGVLRSSNAVLRDNTLSGNGTRTASSFPYFDCGLYVRAASSVLSLGNTYQDNQYCGITAFDESTFRSGGPLFSGDVVDPTETDTIVERGCDFDSGDGCYTSEFSRVAIDVFNGGYVDLRNARVGGEMEVNVQSSFRVDGNAEVKGNILVTFNSAVRVRSREQVGHTVTYTGTLSCDADSFNWGGSVQCDEECDGDIAGEGDTCE